VDVNGWTLSSLTILTVNDVNFTLTATGTVVDGDGNSSRGSAAEAVTVNPQKATVTWGTATPGTEGTAITLGTLAAAVNSLSGDKIGRASCRERGKRAGDTRTVRKGMRSDGVPRAPVQRTGEGDGGTR